MENFILCSLHKRTFWCCWTNSWLLVSIWILKMWMEWLHTIGRSTCTVIRYSRVGLLPLKIMDYCTLYSIVFALLLQTCKTPFFLIHNARPTVAAGEKQCFWPPWWGGLSRNFLFFCLSFLFICTSLISEAAVDAHIHTVGLHSNFCLDGDEDVMEGKVVTSQWIS